MEKSMTDIARGGSAAEKVQDAYGRSLRAMKDAGQTLGDSAKQVGRDVAGYVDKHPFTSLGIAAAVGFIASAMIRR